MDEQTSTTVRMARSEIEFTDDPMPGGSRNSLRLVVWVREDDSPDSQRAAAMQDALDFLERALAALRRG